MILVTGASGFIGRHFVRRAISGGQDLVVLTRNVGLYDKVDSEIVIEGNLREWDSWKNLLRDYDIETCVHLAWEGIPDYSYDCSEKNLVSSLAVLRLCDELDIKNLVITGSCWEYKNPRGRITTKHEMDYSNAFKAAKQSIHMMSSAFCKEKGIHLNWMRVFYAYGPGQREGSLIPYICKCFQNGVVPQLNGLDNENDFVYVEDVAEALFSVARDHPGSEILNIGTGRTVKVSEIVQKVARLKGVSIDLGEQSVKKHAGISFCADFDEMVEMYGWKYHVNIDEGLERTVTEIDMKRKRDK